MRCQIIQKRSFKFLTETPRLFKPNLTQGGARDFSFSIEFTHKTYSQNDLLSRKRTRMWRHFQLSHFQELCLEIPMTRKIERPVQLL